MRSHHLGYLVAAVGVALAGSAVHSQQPGGMRGMGAGMTAMSHDSATMALMATSHQLVMNHDRSSESRTCRTAFGR